MYILLAEDHRDLRTLYTFVLNDAGHEVTAVEDGEKALAEIREHRPDVVVTDIQMPNMDGFELIKHIREEEDIADLPVIVMTAFGKEHEALASAFGANKTLEKPVDNALLCRAINQAFSGIKSH